MSVPNNERPLLLDGEFVSYYPALGVALGSVEDAVVVQHLWFRRDRTTDETEMTAATLAEQVGMKVRTTERRLAGLVSAGVLSKRRKSAYESTSVWSVHYDQIGVSAGQAETATLAVSGYKNRYVETAKVAESETATLAVSIPKEQEEHPPTPNADTSPAVRQDTNPPAPASGGACARHPNNDGVNCRACGTTNRQQAKSQSAETLAMKRRQDAEELRRQRETKPDPEVARRGAAAARAALRQTG